MSEELIVRHGEKNQHLLIVRNAERSVLGTGDTRTGEMTISAQVDPNRVWRALCSHVDWPVDALRPEDDDDALKMSLQHPSAEQYDLAKNPPTKALREREELRLRKLAEDHSGILKQSTVSAKSAQAGGAWDQGTEQEEAVAHEIDALKEKGWFVLHSVPLDTGVIDHLIIGPGGVFAVNTRMHRGKRIIANTDTVSIDGKKYSYVPEFMTQSTRATEVLVGATGLDLKVAPALVLLNGSKRGAETWFSRYILFLNDTDVPGKLLSYSAKLDIIQAGIIYETARKLTTWI